MIGTIFSITNRKTKEKHYGKCYDKYKPVKYITKVMETLDKEIKEYGLRSFKIETVYEVDIASERNLHKHLTEKLSEFVEQKI